MLGIEIDARVKICFKTKDKTSIYQAPLCNIRVTSKRLSTDLTWAFLLYPMLYYYVLWFLAENCLYVVILLYQSQKFFLVLLNVKKAFDATSCLDMTENSLVLPWQYSWRQ